MGNDLSLKKPHPSGKDPPEDADLECLIQKAIWLSVENCVGAENEMQRLYEQILHRIQIEQ